ncbi:MAG: amidohydrolase, partial [Saprospiraceae bacterium]|nr:amidohydrolase [Saprospiraceae bacterium]
MQAALEENKVGLAVWLAIINSNNAAQWNAQLCQSWPTTMEHWYGLPEALFDTRVPYRTILLTIIMPMNRIGFGRVINCGSSTLPNQVLPKWNAVMDELLSLDFTLDPTFNIYG